MIKTYLYEEQMKAKEYVHFDIGKQSVPAYNINRGNKISTYVAEGKVPIIDFSSYGDYDFSNIHYKDDVGFPKIVLPKDGELTNALEELFGKTILFHLHNFIEINQVVSGEMLYIVDGQLCYLKEGDIIVLPNRKPHAWRSMTDDTVVRYINIRLESFIGKNDLFSDEKKLCEHLIKGNLFFVFQKADKAHQSIFDAVEIMMREQEKKIIGYRSIVRAELTNLIFLIGRYININIEQETQLKNANSTSAIKIAIDYINNNISAEVSLAKVAECVHMNRTYFSVYFKQEMGMCFNEYLTKVRMSKAADMLLNTDEKIVSIVSACGYSSISHFNKIFKNTYFTTPSCFREREVRLETH